jgi:hypothetical protein
MEEGHIGSNLPPRWGDLEFLRILDLNFQKLVGPIPDTYYDLTRLNQLDLNDNDLTGSVSEEIGNLEDLQFFEVGNNNLGGPFPQSLGDLSSLSKWVTFVQHIVPSCGIVICHLAPILYLTLAIFCNHSCSRHWNGSKRFLWPSSLHVCKQQHNTNIFSR